jgi:hypothetical protein
MQEEKILDIQLKLLEIDRKVNERENKPLRDLPTQPTPALPPRHIREIARRILDMR